MIVIIRTFYGSFWQWHRIQSKMSLRKPYFGYFFRANRHHCIQVKKKNPKTAKFLKWKWTWEIEKLIELVRPSRSDSDFNRFIKYKKILQLPIRTFLWHFCWTYRLLRNGVLKVKALPKKDFFTSFFSIFTNLKALFRIW